MVVLLEVRALMARPTIITVAGNGTSGYNDNGGPATIAQKDYPLDVAVVSQGNLFIAGTANLMISKSARPQAL
jgi:hypothetical protein